MKKIVAIAVSLVMLLGLSVTAFAATSPGGTTYHRVVLVMNDTDKPTVTNAPYTVEKEADALTFTAKKSADTDVFLGWVIYKSDGTVATAGTDYTLVESNSVTGTALAATIPQVQHGIDRFGAALQTVANTVDFEGKTLITDTTITLIPKTDLIVTANWNSKLTGIKSALEAFKDKSDKTGDTAAAVIACAAVLALGGVVISKKQLAK